MNLNKLQYFGHLMQRVDSLEKTLMLGVIGAGGEEHDRRWDGWMASRTRWTCVWMNSWSWWWIGTPGVLGFMGSQNVGHNWVTEMNWTPWRKVMTNLDSILKSRDITLSTKVCLFKAMVFPVVIYGCESWTVKKAECQRIGAFELWYWRRLFESPFDC